VLKSFFLQIRIILRFLSLTPLSWGYALGLILHRAWTRFRHRKRPRLPVFTIIVGNLSVGGTGKTPHLLALAKALQGQYALGLLSRGYGRERRGILEVHSEDAATAVGDEPLLLKTKLPTLPVFVAEDRYQGIQALLKAYPQTEVLLLDDGLQHWAFEADLKICLSSYQSPFSRDHLLPLGRLREPRNGYRRMDALILTKCPKELSRSAQNQWQAELSPLPHQALFFTYLAYGLPYHWFHTKQQLSWEQVQCQHILVFCGIAKPEVLSDFLQNKSQGIYPHFFPDHHFFSQKEIERLLQAFEQIPQPRILLCTEKDAVRLQAFAALLQEQPLYVLSLEAQALNQDDWCHWAKKQVENRLKSAQKS
jgi:tetraacyldisaccharide 4'-kinase